MKKLYTQAYNVYVHVHVRILIQKWYRCGARYMSLIVKVSINVVITLTHQMAYQHHVQIDYNQSVLHILALYDLVVIIEILEIMLTPKSLFVISVLHLYHRTQIIALKNMCKKKNEKYSLSLRCVKIPFERKSSLFYIFILTEAR